ncbi:DUF5819 family protein [Leifsonia sp. NCR5]|uniref:DUF5819 family protein n=1 Tax=Leifsonia sp. NCR5 TaxID=1978342 RepID=UPI0015C453BB|nr:DUF5819 family protein [Leifsonia sp. NCR5]
MAVIGAVGTAYVSSVLMAAGPLTPLSVKYGPAANEVLSPYFQQNWQLFAPRPISEERGLVARVKCQDSTVTKFRDVTSEHIDAVQSSRLFPSRMSRVVSNGMVQVFLEDPILTRLRADQESRKPADAHDKEDEIPLSSEEKEVRTQGEAALVRFAHRALESECATTVQAVQLRYVLHSFPRWSERHQWRETGTVDVLESDWFEVSA